MIRILCIDSDREACGIKEYSRHLQANLPGTCELYRGDGWLGPERFFADLPALLQYQGPQVVWLNYHAALHSRWEIKQIHQLRAVVKLPVVVTYHDTGVPNSEQCMQLFWGCRDGYHDAAPGAFIIHEPCDDLPGAIYLRQGVPAAAQYPADYVQAFGLYGWRDGRGVLYEKSWKAFPQQPVLGTFGFNFPWKQYDELARVTGDESWALVILSNNATDEDERRWRDLNHSTLVVRGYLPPETVINYLAGCDATAFMYACANTGTSAAIRYGVAARKPVIALRGCRQMRDLQLLDRASAAPVGPSGIAWVEGWPDFRLVLRGVQPHPWQAEVMTRAHEDAWTKQAQRYADIFQGLV